MLAKLGILNDDGKVSITNVMVYIFLLITAFKTMFSGASFSLNVFNWKVEPLDLSANLPLLFSLINYGHKRSVLSHKSSFKEKEEG